MSRSGRGCVPNKWPRFCVQNVAAFLCPENGRVAVSQHGLHLVVLHYNPDPGHPHATIFWTRTRLHVLDTQSRPLSGHKNVAICWALKRVRFGFGWYHILRSPHRHARVRTRLHVLDTKSRPLSGHKNVAIFWARKCIRFRFGWYHIVRSTRRHARVASGASCSPQLQHLFASHGNATALS